MLWLGAREGPPWTVAQRLRFDGVDVTAAVEEVRELVRRDGRSGLTWEVSSSATPAGLADRLAELGMAPDREPDVAALVLRREPQPAPPGIEVRRAETPADRRAHARIGAIAFGDRPDARPTPPAETHRAHYVALLDGEPVGAASATFTEWGVVMNGGSTLPGARGRGAYRALVRARWDDAVARGTPALVTQAGALSLPILERLGFEEVARIRVLLDELPGRPDGRRAPG